MDNFLISTFLVVSFLVPFVMLLKWVMPPYEKIKCIWWKFWHFGTRTPIQRYGLILLLVGLLSLLTWCNKKGLYLSDVFSTDYFPRSRDFIFFHLYLYFIPLGLMTTWLYPFMLHIKKWIYRHQ